MKRVFWIVGFPVRLALATMMLILMPMVTPNRLDDVWDDFKDMVMDGL
jgi:hypothetical protein